MRFSIDRRRLAPGAALLLVAGVACTGDSGARTPLGVETDADVVVSVTVSPALDSLELGDTVRLTASALDRAGGKVAASLAWSSSAPSVATVDASGLVKAVGEGSAEVSARAGGRSGSSWCTSAHSAPRTRRPSRTRVPAGRA